MILSNKKIVEAINKGSFSICPLEKSDPASPPFNTTSIDLRLGSTISVFKKCPAAFDVRKGGIAQFLSDNSEESNITIEKPYTLMPNQLVLAQTKERVDFPINKNKKCYSARVEGKSSIARCGLLVHFTAPTIHAGFSGTITLEIINLGMIDFLLFPDMYICQLIIEEVQGTPVSAPNQFMGQNTPSGLKKVN